MDARDLLATFLATEAQTFVPHLSVDCAVFGFHGGELKILLLQWKHVGRWSLPGGYVRRDEAVDDAAARVLRERTGLDRIYLEQFRAFGGVQRGEGVVRELFSAMGVAVPPGHWIAERIVSLGYLALVDYAEATPTPDAVSAECRWWDVHDRPPLILDHDEIVATALRTLRAQASYLPIGRNLLPEKFTMPQLQRLHEAVLGRPLDRRNFQKKMLDLGFVERLPERQRGGAHRAPYLYRFDPQAYRRALEAARGDDAPPSNGRRRAAPGVRAAP